MVLDRILENEMSNPIMDMEVAQVMVVAASAQKQESEILTKSQGGVGHKIYSEKCSFCDAMVEANWKENGHHVLDKNNQRHVCKWNGYFCSPVFYPGGVQLFLHGWVSAMVLEVIKKLEAATVVFDPGKGNLNPTYTTQFALHFIVGTKLWYEGFHVFDPDKFESLYFTHTQPWGQGCYMEGVVWYIEEEYIILTELRRIQGGILWYFTKGCPRHFNGSSAIRFYIQDVAIIVNIRDDEHQPVLDSLKVLDSMKEQQDSNEIEILAVNGHKSRKKDEYCCFGPFDPGGTRYTVNGLAIDHGVMVNWMQVYRRCIPIGCVMKWQRAWLSRFQLKFMKMKMTSYMMMRSRLIYSWKETKVGHTRMRSKVVVWPMFQFITTINSSAYKKQFFNFIPTLRARLLCEGSNRVHRKVVDHTTMRYMRKVVYMIRKRDIQVNELRCCSSTTLTKQRGQMMQWLRLSTCCDPHKCEEVFIVFSEHSNFVEFVEYAKSLTQVLALLIEKEEVVQELWVVLSIYGSEDLLERIHITRIQLSTYPTSFKLEHEAIPDRKIVRLCTFSESIQFGSVVVGGQTIITIIPDESMETFGFQISTLNYDTARISISLTILTSFMVWVFWKNALQLEVKLVLKGEGMLQGIPEMLSWQVPNTFC